MPSQPLALRRSVLPIDRLASDPCRVPLRMLLLCCCAFLSAPNARAIDPFPGIEPGVEIGSGLSAGFEPSGGAWHSRLNQFFVCGDNNALARMNRDGSSTTNWTLSGNWEGIAVANPASDFVFVVNENTAHIREFNFVSGVAGREFDLTTATPGPAVPPLTATDLDALVDGGDSTGAEALTFVPDAGDPEGGTFWVGSQENGAVYKFRLSLSSGTAVTYLGTFKSWSPNDLQGLEYDWINRYAVLGVFGASNRLMAVTTAGALAHEWQLPEPSSTGEEGLGYDGRYLFICHDPAATSEVWRYDGFWHGVPVRLSGLQIE